VTLADDTAGLEHRFVDTNGVKLHAAIGGPQDGPLVMLLHGFPECWLCWRHQFQPLMKAGFRVVAPDMRGYNTSDKPREVSAYRTAALVEDIAGLVRALGRERAHVVGHDWGGVVSWHLAHRRSDVLDRLVILNCPHPITFLKRTRSLDQMRRMYYVFLFQLPLLPERAISRDDFRALRNIFKYQPKKPGAYDDEDLRVYVEAFSQPGAVSGPLNYYRAMVRSMIVPGGGGKEHTIKRVIDRPTLVLWGMDDAVLPPENLEGIDERVEKLEIVRIPNCSHWVTHDAPDVVNRELLRFLQ
jgi:pimeloyl-ACP methyl ester carboxylesterase